MNRITIFHYHLLPGGVTNVILLGVKALIRHLPEIDSIRLVCGLEQNTDKILGAIKQEAAALPGGRQVPRVESVVLPGIYYTDPDGPVAEEDVAGLAARLVSEYGDSFWWVHNYQLGKNPLFTAAIVRIADTVPSQKMLLHIHDFPECARFDNLGRLNAAGVTNPYPAGRNAAYCCINGRDTELLKHAGVPEEQVFLLNNPVENEPKASAGGMDRAAIKEALYKRYKRDFPAMKPDAPLIFYPVRTIRRKNILEAGLIASLSVQPVNLAVSLPGVSEQESRYSDTCRTCFAEGLIPGIWGSGTDTSPDLPDYPGMLANSDMIISSSVQEGFGYLFINAVQLGVPLMARDLDILNGIRGIFPAESCSFYKSITIPLEAGEAGEVRSAYRKKLAAIEEYISGETAAGLAGEIESLGYDGKLDFSFLPVDMQVGVLRRINESDEFTATVRAMNADLTDNFYRLLNFGGAGSPSRAPDSEIFSLSAHAETVGRIIDFLYSTTAYDPAPGIRKNTIQQRLLDSFAELKYMRLLYDY